jgi:regulator of protease activity HflC (stomatin/prohibitin superfamily)
MRRIAAILFAILLAGCEQIETGNVGIESTMGQVKDHTLPPGVYVTVFKTVYEISAKENPIEINDIKPKTKDNITMADVDLTVYFNIGATFASKVFVKYAGDMDRGQASGYVLGKGLVTRMTREATYNAVSKHNSWDIHLNREAIAADVRAALQKEIDNDAGKGMFVITNVLVRNLLTDARLEESIKAAAEVTFQVRQKEQQIILAKAESERMKVAAEGEARANQIIAQSLTPTLLELRRIEAMQSFATKGNSTVVLQGGAQPLISIK